MHAPLTHRVDSRAIFNFLLQVIQIETRDLRDTDALSASLLQLNMDAASSHHRAGAAPTINATQHDDVTSHDDDVTEKTVLTVPKS